ncbi:hypothetical protein LEWO105114_12240 [Legionella worsleiensis]|nr:Uncharacterised protein [Legionella worsleiensis]
MKKERTCENILFLVVLYTCLFFWYEHIQAFKEDNRKNEIVINELLKR